jgi:hypothetical protein
MCNAIISELSSPCRTYVTFSLSRPMPSAVSVKPITTLDVHVLPHDYYVPAHTDETVDRLWQTATSANSRLFDGRILCVSSIAEDSLCCRIIPYRYIWAQRQTPELKSRLKLCPLGVSGFTHSDTHILFGVRNNQVMQYPGYLEAVPSGGVNDAVVAGNGTADFTRQLQEELLEESGISASSLMTVTPMFLLYDEVETTYDICCQVKVSNAALLETAHMPPGDEYEKLLPVAYAELATFINSNSSRIMPTSLMLLQQQKLFALN